MLSGIFLLGGLHMEDQQLPAYDFMFVGLGQRGSLLFKNKNSGIRISFLFSVDFIRKSSESVSSSFYKIIAYGF
jgi:hypothetical protein